MAVPTEREKLKKAGTLHWFHWVVILLSIFLTFFAWSVAKNGLDAKRTIQFEREADQTIELVLERMQKYEDALWGGVALIRTLGGEIDYDTWLHYSGSIHIEQKYPGINGIGVIYAMPIEEVPSFLALQRKRRPNFAIYPEHDGREYYPITFIEPVEGNEEAVGLDMAHESNRFTAAKNTRDTGMSQITGPITLVQDAGKTPGFLFYAPFYQGGIYGSVAQRRKHFSGMVYAPFVVKKLMEGVLAKQKRHVGVRISDGQNVLYDELVASEEDFDSEPEYRKQADIPLYGRNWRFDIWSAKSFREAGATSQPTTILVGGIFIDCLLMILFISISRSNRRALAYADAMNSELVANAKKLEIEIAERKQAEESLQKAHDNLEYRVKERTADLENEIAERKRMEEGLRRAQSLESLGILAGGIAHDFNNVLTGVIGNLALLELRLDKDTEEYEMVAEAKAAADKTKGFTSQLLTFARGGAPVKETASIDELIKEAVAMSLHGANTKPDYQLADDLWPVDIDVGQIGQVIQNIVINADQAMPNGGVLKLSASNAEISEQDALPLAPGSYVKVTVADQGIGMSEKVMEQIFDPYFTTKDRGHGLGLSITYSIVHRHGGHITVDSVPDEGTTFEFYLPVSEKQPAAAARQEKEIARGTGRVLLMDDEEIIHKAVGRGLTILGYEVASAYDGDEALRMYDASLKAGSPYDVVLTDLTIPGGMGGEELVKRLHEIDPEALVIVSSGYASDPVMANSGDYGFAGTVRKPVDLDELAETMKRVLPG